MDFNDSPEEIAWRDEYRAWLAENAPSVLSKQPLEHGLGEIGGGDYMTRAKAWQAKKFDAGFARELGATGWIGLAWPRAFGGQQRTPLEQLAFLDVMERAEAPPRVGAAVQANALMMFGTPAQQQRWLPEILRGEAMHGMGYSEPDAGSDLASLRTSAVLDGDEWVINGQKIWTTTYWGRYMFLAARTDREAKPQQAGQPADQQPGEHRRKHTEDRDQEEQLHRFRRAALETTPADLGIGRDRDRIRRRVRGIRP